jgi:glycosyltransferase involved in cell wall biosynthesis
VRESSTRVGLVAPLPPQVGGVTSVADWLLTHQEEIGCSYSTFDLARPPEAGMGARLHAGAVPRQLRQFGRFIAWGLRAPTLIHYCMSTSQGGLPRDAAYLTVLRLLGKTTIAHVHGAYLPVAAEMGFRSKLLRIVGRVSSERVAISPSAARTLAGLGISSRCILNPLRFAPEEPATATHDGQPPFRLLFAGAYGRRKGCPELIEALGRVRKLGIDARLTIVGNEDQLGDDALVRTRVRSRHLEDSVEFAGVKESAQMPGAYAVGDVFCLPSRHEGLPMAMLEAMAFGLPVIATPVGGVPDLVVHGETGLLVAPGDVEELTEAIATLASDAGLRCRLGSSGRDRVLELASSPIIAAQWRDLYTTLAEGS